MQINKIGFNNQNPPYKKNSTSFGLSLNSPKTRDLSILERFGLNIGLKTIDGAEEVSFDFLGKPENGEMTTAIMKFGESPKAYIACIEKFSMAKLLSAVKENYQSFSQNYINY